MSFINPIFLFAAATALLPILYHLIRNKRARKVKFSSLLFFKATPKEVIRRRRLQDLLLLIIRCAILGILALVFARPFIPKEAIPFISQIQNKSVVFLVDNSYSMQYANLFEQAKQEIEDRLNEANEADEFSIVVFSDEPRQLSELSTDLSMHKNIVKNSLQPSNRTTDFYKPVRLAEDILKDAKHKDKQIILISDLQKNGLSNQFENWNIDPAIHFIPIQIGGEYPVNAYIEKFTLNKKRRGEKVATRYGLQIVIPEEETSNKVTLIVNGKQVDAQKTGVGISSQVYFQQENLRKGLYQGNLRLNEDKLPIDNVYYFGFEVDERPSILCIDNSPQYSNSSAFYLEKCINMGDQSLYRFSRGRTSKLSTRQLVGIQVLFLSNVRSLSKTQLSTLENYVQKGGTLIISFGDIVNQSRFSNNLKDLGVGVITEKVRVRKIQSASAIIGEVDFKHPVFSVFAQSKTGDIFNPKFQQYFKITPDSNAMVIGRYDTGDPFLIERILGDGKIIVFTSTFNTEWGDFPVNEIYLPFVYQLVKYATLSSAKRNSFFVADAILLEGNSGDVWEISAPGDKIFKVEIDQSGLGYFRDTEIPGNYQAVLNSQKYYFSVNVNASESDLSVRDPEEVYAAVTGPRTAEQEIQTADLAGMNQDEKNQKMWRYILFFIVVLFLLETFLANRRA